jgi:hypothetical protein
VAKNGVLSVGGVDGDVAVAKGLARDNVLLQDVKIDEGRACACFGGGDAPWGRLRDYFGACANGLVIRSSFYGAIIRSYRERVYLLEGRIWRKRCLVS